MAERPDRLFVAVPLPQQPLAACVALIDAVRSGPLGDVPRWVHVANLHLTVRFLGETPPDLTPDAAMAVRDALAGARAFDVVLAGAGAFPEARKPRALWLGIEQGAAELGALADALDPALEPLGWPRDDRPYRPHLTVARLDRSSIASSGVIADTLRAAAADWRTAFRADRVVLYRSHLGSGPPRYEPLVDVALLG
ncbi:MAG TPA: RNA 2',3'-cyclic phosphodiesterase [Candidatus Limnocylindrales bacterium]|nr:RNA 2',3'-cyclic phosphodiesterase [Candidatus Limnocylindrales bacterium]